MRISKSLRLAACSLMVAAVAGCAQSRPRKTVAANEPPLIEGDSGATAVVEAPQARTASAADRHPMLRRPREYYDTTSGSKLTKTAAAAVIGVPSGIAAEMKQIVTGQPAPR